MTFSPASEPPSVAGVDTLDCKETPAFGVNTSNNSAFIGDGVARIGDEIGASLKLRGYSQTQATVRVVLT